MGRFETENRNLEQHQAPAGKPVDTLLPTTLPGAADRGSWAWDEKPAKPSNLPQMQEFPDAGKEPMGFRPIRPSYLRKDTGEMRNMMLRDQFHKRRQQRFADIRESNALHQRGTNHIDTLTSTNNQFATTNNTHGALLPPYLAAPATTSNTFIAPPIGAQRFNDDVSHQPFGTHEGRAFDGQQPAQPHLFLFDGQQPLIQPQQQQFMFSGIRAIEHELLSKPPLRHWNFEPTIVYQPDIDQAPKYTRRVRFQPRERPHALIRLRQMRQGVAWSIPVYDQERRAKGGLAWTIEMDGDFYSKDATAATKTSKKAKKAGIFRRFKKFFASGRSSRWVEPLPPPPLAPTHGIAAKDGQRQPVVIDAQEGDHAATMGGRHRRSTLNHQQQQQRGAFVPATNATQLEQGQPTVPLVRARRPLVAVRRAIPGNPNEEVLVARPFRVREQYRVQLIERPVDVEARLMKLRTKKGHRVAAVDQPASVIETTAHMPTVVSHAPIVATHAAPVKDVPLIRQAPPATADGAAIAG